jgi:sarcosine oxidase
MLMMVTDQTEGVYLFSIIPHPRHKFALHYRGNLTEADRVNREVGPRHSWALLCLKFLPSGFGEIESTKVCLYSNSPDEHFVIDNLPGMEEHVCVAWGFSGHGFKFVPVVGEILADLAMYGQTDLPINFLNANRFK